MRTLPTLVTALVLTASTGLATPAASASTGSAETRAQISERLGAFEYQAAMLRKDLDVYASFVRSGKPHFTTHSRNLDQARMQVNGLGQELTRLEALSPEGTAAQQEAIRQARAHLAPLADHLQATISMLNEEQRVHHLPAFREQVLTLYQHADTLDDRMDAVNDQAKQSTTGA